MCLTNILLNITNPSWLCVQPITRVKQISIYIGQFNQYVGHTELFRLSNTTNTHWLNIYLFIYLLKHIYTG